MNESPLLRCCINNNQCFQTFPALRYTLYTKSTYTTLYCVLCTYKTFEYFCTGFQYLYTDFQFLQSTSTGFLYTIILYTLLVHFSTCGTKSTYVEAGILLCNSDLPLHNFDPSTQNFILVLHCHLYQFYHFQQFNYGIFFALGFWKLVCQIQLAQPSF